MINKEIKRTKNDNTYQIIPTTHLLNYCILCIGKKPHVLPQMSLKKYENENIEKDNIQVKISIENDLFLIKAMLIGVLNNYNNYKDKSRFSSFAIELGTTIIQSAISLAKII